MPAGKKLQIQTEYPKKFKKIDDTFAADSDEVINGTKGPFSKAQDRFYTKRIISLEWHSLTGK